MTYTTVFSRAFAGGMSVATFLAFASVQQAHAQSLNQLNFQAHSGYEITTGVAGQNLDLTTKTSDGGGIGIGPRNSTSLFIDTAGEVGIGTTSPETRLQISGGEDANRISQDDGYDYTEMAQRSWSGSHGIFFGAYKSPISVDGGLGATGNMKYKRDAGSYGYGAGGIIYYANGGSMNFLISPSSTGAGTDVNWGTSIMSLARSGSVGIGTTSPADRLHVSGGNITVSGIANCSAAGSVLKTDANGRIVCGTGGGGSGTANRLAKWNAAGNALVDTVSPVFENTSGNVGIGNSSPGYKLDVTGTIHGAQLINGGFDFILGNDDQSSRGNSGSSRALVKNGSAMLYVNYSGDFTGGTQIGTNAFFANSGSSYINTGNVGIGTSGPGTKLEVYGGDMKLNGGALYLAGTAGQTATQLFSYNNASSLWLIQPSSQHLLLSDAVDWDRGVSFQYTPGTTGGAAGALKIGQFNKNSATWTHGVTQFYTNGTERMRIDSAGNVGIATASPADKLQVSGNATISGIANCSAAGSVLKTDANGRIVCGTGGGGSGTANVIPKWNAAGNALVDTATPISESGTNVGIGTSSPGVKLDVRGPVGINGQTSNGTSHYQFDGGTYRNPADFTPSLLVRQDNGTTGTSGFKPALTLYNDIGSQSATVGMAFASREETSAGNSVDLAGIMAVKESVGVNNGWSQGGMNFFVKNMGSKIDAMYINSSGSVGIGTAGPEAKLHLYGVGGSLPATSGTAQTGAALRIQANGTNEVFDIGSVGGGSGSWLQVTNRTSLGSYYSLLLNPNGGNVGVGISNPAYKLDVGGVIRANAGSSIAGIFNSTNDAQITLQSADSWTGIGFNDSGSVDEYIWYNGANGTFAIGGGGSNVAGKKLHVNGGMSVGANSSGTSVPTNGLYVEGNVGIGDAAPADKLDVNGNATITGIANCAGSNSVLKTDSNGRIVCSTAGAASMVQASTCSATSISVNWSQGPTQYCKLTGNVTSITFSGGVSGGSYKLLLKQDATGNRTVSSGAWPASVHFGNGGSATPSLSASANAVDYLGFVFNTIDGANTYDNVSFNTGF
jgi:hypothetical protein